MERYTDQAQAPIRAGAGVEREGLGAVEANLIFGNSWSVRWTEMCRAYCGRMLGKEGALPQALTA